MPYGQPTPSTSNVATGDNNIDGLLSLNRWDSTTVTYSFTDDFINDYEDELGYPNSVNHAPTFSSINVTQRAVARSIMEDMYEAVSGLDLVEESGASDRDATIRIGASAQPRSAYARLPGNTVQSGDIWFNQNQFTNPIIGNRPYRVFMHEIGHALGLKHGHEVSGVAGVSMNSDRDTMEFSVMTYRSYEGDSITDIGYPNETWGFSQTLMMYDIAAVQSMYGANFNTHSSNTVYTFDTLTGEMFINGSSQGIPGANRIFRTIWDGDGHDTYDFSNYTTDLAIDLAPGGWSDLDVGGNAQRAYLGHGNYARGHVFNALLYDNDERSLIESAHGGSGDDFIEGNQADNGLRGNAGDDIIYGREDGLSIQSGDDFIVGGEGSDVLHGQDGDDTIYGGDFGSGGGLPTDSDTLFGGGGDDNLRGADGNDTLDGGSNDDYIRGNDGDDWLEGGIGDDTIDGNAGIDTVSYANAMGSVTVSLKIGTATGADGTDTITNIENIVGSDFDDTLTGNIEDNIIDGGAGHNILNGKAGNDTIINGTGIDTLNGGFGVDTLQFAYDGPPFLTGYTLDMTTGITNIGETATNFENVISNHGADHITGTAGENLISTGLGDDTINGAGGNDTLMGGAGTNTIDGGAGTGDVVSYEDVLESVVVDLGTATGTSGDRTDTLLNIEHVAGSNFNDTLTGDIEDNQLRGNAGEDTLTGGAGNDVLTGGLGHDFFVVGDGLDTIRDFQDGIDFIDVSILGITSVAQLSMSSQGSGDTLITDSNTGNDLVLALGVDPSLINEFDFIFA